jgi:hypothetical protein
MRLAAMSSTLLNQRLGSRPSAAACLRRLCTLPGPALYDAKANSALSIARIAGSPKKLSTIQRLYLMPAWMLLSRSSMSGMFTALSRAVAGITCMTPMAPTGLRRDWSRPDS